MLTFKKWIEVDEERFEFFFIRIYQVEGARIFVMVFDGNHRLLTFKMKKKAIHVWEIENPLQVPFWILELERELAITINEFWED